MLAVGVAFPRHYSHWLNPRGVSVAKWKSYPYIKGGFSISSQNRSYYLHEWYLPFSILPTLRHHEGSGTFIHSFSSFLDLTFSKNRFYFFHLVFESHTFAHHSEFGDSIVTVAIFVFVDIRKCSNSKTLFFFWKFIRNKFYQFITVKVWEQSGAQYFAKHRFSHGSNWPRVSELRVKWNISKKERNFLQKLRFFTKSLSKPDN